MVRAGAAITLTALAAGLFGSACEAAGVLADGAKWEKVSSAGRGTGEGVVAGKDGAIYVTDLTYTQPDNPGGTIYRYDPATGQTTKVMEPSGMANGMAIDRNGDLIIAQAAYGGARALVKRNLATGAVTPLVDSYQGKRLIAPNDVTVDAQGRIYFTDGRFNSAEEPELPNAVYRLDPDGKLTQLGTGVLRPNGIEISPDGKRLYVLDTVSPRLKPNPVGPAADKFGITKGGVVVYDLAPDGSISDGRLFWRTEVALTDGVAIDTDGNLYVAANDTNASQIVALDPNGNVLQELPLPETGAAVQLGFGRGADAGSLYLSTRPWGLWRIRTTRTGFYQR